MECEECLLITFVVICWLNSQVQGQSQKFPCAVIFHSTVVVFVFTKFKEKFEQGTCLKCGYCIVRLSVVFDAHTLLADEVYKSCIHLAGCVCRRCNSGGSRLQRWKSSWLYHQMAEEEICCGHGRLYVCVTVVLWFHSCPVSVFLNTSTVGSRLSE